MAAAGAEFGDRVTRGRCTNDGVLATMRLLLTWARTTRGWSPSQGGIPPMACCRRRSSPSPSAGPVRDRRRPPCRTRRRSTARRSVGSRRSWLPNNGADSAGEGRQRPHRARPRERRPCFRDSSYKRRASRSRKPSLCPTTHGRKGHPARLQLATAPTVYRLNPSNFPVLLSEVPVPGVTPFGTPFPV